MKYSAALVSLALATSVAAQGLADLPECARDCATQYLRGGIGNCGSDPECICKNSTFLDSIACCLVDVCNDADQKKAVSVAATLCKAFGVNDLPTTVVCGTLSPSASTPVKTSTPAATGGANTSAAVTTTPTGTATDATDAPSTTETETPEESSATETDADAQDASSSSSTSTSTNFGPRPTVAAGLGAIGGLAAAFVLL
ncbi:hypothetical protein QBC36DRAFT_328780 [Triangularia setosa]|uniref:CFEM domain-containing protein n=1 Tax=Triangularia setosa TaxID=2587417 RepID=A0AAN6W7J4_9PEZI|nr:hypothetical protein QBC36DRAFT_328780 [Podospora setosa]